MKNITFVDSKNRSWDYQIPFNITCTVSGAVKVYTSEEYINGKIERFDGLDNLRKNYVSRDAKRAAKAVQQLVPNAAPTPPVTEEVKPNVFADLIGKQPAEEPAPKPIAKQDKRGCYRNAKGHIIAKDKLDQYELVAYVPEAAAA
jgi:hypothetical protein